MTAHPTHTARAAQHHGEDIPEQAQPGEGEAVRSGMEKSKLERDAEAYKAKKAASKAKDKARAVEYKAERERAKIIPANLFNPNRYSCWMTGHGQKMK